MKYEHAGVSGNLLVEVSSASAAIHYSYDVHNSNSKQRFTFQLADYRIIDRIFRLPVCCLSQESDVDPLSVL